VASDWRISGDKNQLVVTEAQNTDQIFYQFQLTTLTTAGQLFMTLIVY
jgi:hypothetical protein